MQGADRLPVVLQRRRLYILPTRAGSGFALLLLQGWSELIKRIAFLKGLIEDPTVKKIEKTAEEELAESIRQLAEREGKQV